MRRNRNGHTGHRWIGPGEIDLMAEHRVPGDDARWRIVAAVGDPAASGDGA